MNTKEYKTANGRTYHLHYAHMCGVDGAYVTAIWDNKKYTTAFYHPAEKFDPEQGVKDIDYEIERSELKKETNNARQEVLPS